MSAAALSCYEIRYLVAHLDQLARSEPARAADIHRLLRAETVERESVVEEVEQPRARRRWLHLSRRVPAAPVRREVVRDRRRNVWYESKSQLGDVGGFLADIQCAEEWAARQSAAGLEVRYALMRASVNSLSGRLPPALLAALVAHDVWTPERALVYARTAPSANVRARALIALAPYVDGDNCVAVIDEALEEVAAIVDEITFETRVNRAEAQAQALTEAAPYLSTAQLSTSIALLDHGDEQRTRSDLAWRAFATRLARLGHSGEALALARFRRAELWWDILGDLAPLLPEPSLRELLGEDDAKERTVTLLAPQLARCGDIAGALALIGEITYEYWLARALSDFAQYLPPDAAEWESVRQLACELHGWDETDRAHALTGLAATCPGKLRRPLFDEVLHLASAQAPIHRADTLLRLAHAVTDADADRVLAAARTLDNPTHRTPILARVAALSPGHRPAARALLQTPGTWWPAGFLEALAAIDPGVALRAVLKPSSGSASREHELAGLERIVPALPRDLLEAVLDASVVIGDRGWLQRKDAELASFAAVHAPRSVADCLTIEDQSTREKALALHLPELESLAVEPLLDLARTVESSRLRARLLRLVASRLPRGQRMALAMERGALHAFAAVMDDDELRSTLAVLRTRKQEVLRVDGLTALVSHLPDDALTQAVEDVPNVSLRPGPVFDELLERTIRALCSRGRFADARALLARVSTRTDIPDDVEMRMLVHLAQTVPALDLPAINADARARTGDDSLWQRAGLADVLLVVARRVGGHEGRALVAEAAKLAWSAATEVGRGTETVAAVMAQANTRDRAWLLEHLYAPETSFKNSWTKGEILAELMPLLTGDDRSRALDAIRDLPPDQRAARLLKVRPCLPVADDESLLREIAVATASITNDYSRTEALADFAQAVTTAGRSPAHAGLQSLLSVLSRRRRSSLLTDLPALAPILHCIGAGAALEETRIALADVAAWWP